MKVHIRLAGLASALVLLVCAPVAWAKGNHAGGHDQSSIGEAGVAANVQREVIVDMSDTMRFTPNHVMVKRGETIRFIIKNSGQLTHEFVLGSAKELKAHYALMKKFPGMEHSDPNMASVAAGQSGEVVWQFTQGGKIDFACLQPGHFEAGMKGAVTVAAAKPDGHTQHQH